MVAELLEHWEDGRIKLFITVRGLGMRRECPDLFLRGAYLPLEIEGPASGHVGAFARQWKSSVLIVIAPRLVAGFVGAGLRLRTGSDVWSATALKLPESLPRTGWRNLFTGERAGVTVTGGPGIALARVLTTCPVALLEADQRSPS